MDTGTRGDLTSTDKDESVSERFGRRVRTVSLEAFLLFIWLPGSPENPQQEKQSKITYNAYIAKSYTE